jgi:serine/threonine protein kinase
MKQMVNAVHYLQKLNIIHRDIKPENIMVSDDNTLKLSDFGWSIKTRNSSRKTFCGTPDYFCPEIIRYKPFDYKIDNWSLGILAYELLFGKPPFYSP